MTVQGQHGDKDMSPKASSEFIGDFWRLSSRIGLKAVVRID
jgi:hypothetical protein